jgi:hypothetical protein
VELPIFPEKKERPTEAPFLSWKKAIARKSLKRSAGNSSRKRILQAMHIQPPISDKNYLN